MRPSANLVMPKTGRERPEDSPKRTWLSMAMSRKGLVIVPTLHGSLLVTHKNSSNALVAVRDGLSRDLNEFEKAAGDEEGSHTKAIVLEHDYWKDGLDLLPGRVSDNPASSQ